MPQRIDHVIVLGADLDALEATYTQLGFTVVGGGTHPHLGTKNRIILLGEGYLELLALADAKRASPVLARRLPAHPGWVGAALQSDDIAAETAAMAARGADVHGPTPGQLVAPDGRTRSWRVSLIGAADFWTAASSPQPFLIQHDSTGARHLEELAGGAATAPNPNGAIGMTSLTIAVRDLVQASTHLTATYGLRLADDVILPQDEGLNAHRRVLPLPSGERIILAQPAGEGIVARRIIEVGEGLSVVSISVRDLGATARYLAARGVTFTRDENRVAVTAGACGGAPLAFVQA